MVLRIVPLLAVASFTACINPLSSPFQSRQVPAIDASAPYAFETKEEITHQEPALTPRKNYDLKEELRLFKLCKDRGQCMITSNESLQAQVMLTTHAPDFFIWAIRTSGLLVIGSGPDEMMTHGLLASVDLASTDRVLGAMGSVYAAGEGSYDPLTKTLSLNNKSGHYRPEFSRVNNLGVERLFRERLPNPVAIQFIDLTKPRVVEIY